MIMINSQHTLELLEKCLRMKEDRVLRCGNPTARDLEPWGYSVMCAAAGLLETHLGTKTPEVAKAASAERFINLHYKLMAGRDPPASSQQPEQARPLAPTPMLGPFGGQVAAAEMFPPRPEVRRKSILDVDRLFP